MTTPYVWPVHPDPIVVWTRVANDPNAPEQDKRIARHNLLMYLWGTK